MPGASLEAGDKKINKTWWLHSRSSWPVADTANERQLQGCVLSARCWELSAELRARPSEGSNPPC